jgi:hypothetical protein
MANFFGVGQSPLGNPFPRTLQGFQRIPNNMLGRAGGGSPMSRGEFFQDTRLNPWGGSNDVASNAAYERYLQGFGGGGGGAVGPVQGGPGGGALPGSWSPASGGIPQTPVPAQSLANLLSGIGGNIGALGSTIGGITSAQQKALRDQYPTEYFDTLSTLQGNVARRAQGDATDLIPMWGQNAAEWGIGQGVSGPALASKFAQDVFGGIHNLQREAIQDEATLKGLYPTVAPYDPARLLPGFDDQIGWEDVGNVRGAAPIPEAAFNRNLALANQGLNRGFGAGFSPVQQFRPGGPLFQPNAGFGMPPGVATAPTVPGGPGWGFGFGQGGFAGAGNIPPGEINQFIEREGFGPPQFDQGPGFFENAGNIWDTPFDMPIDFGGDQFFEEFDEFFD